MHRIIERIEYKLLFLTYKVLTITQPPYFHKLISVQRPRSTRSLSVFTLYYSATDIILSKNYRHCNINALCFTLFLESIPFISSSSSF